jgi:hypothetical protein
MFARLIFLALLALLVSSTVRGLHVGIDFYHFWIVGAARERSEARLGSPFTESTRYAAVLNAEADRIWGRYLSRAEIQQLTENPELLSRALEQIGARHGRAAYEQVTESSRFLSINLRRRALDLTGTPLLYALCTALPSSYAAAYGLWTCLSLAAFLVGAAILLRASGWPWGQALLWSTAFGLVLRPLSSDLRVGNMNSLHLLVLALALAVALVPLRRAQDAAARVRWASIVLSLVVLHALSKPTFLCADLALGGHVAWVLGWRELRRALWAPLLAAVALLALPMLVLGEASIWLDWIGYVGQHEEKLAYDLEKGNLSTPLHLHTWFSGLSLGAWSLLLALGLLASLAAVASRFPAASAAARARLLMEHVLLDPLGAASLGIVLTLALAPLVWGHYLTVLVVPLLWFTRWEFELEDDWRKRLYGALVLPSAFLYTGMMEVVLSIAGWESSEAALRSCTAFAWVPLWTVLLIWVAQRCEKGAVDEPAEARLVAA